MNYLQVRTAILTCPVDCIHYVDWPELVRLEKEREGVDINFKAKLVGNDHDNAANGMQVCVLCMYVAWMYVQLSRSVHEECTMPVCEVDPSCCCYYCYFGPLKTCRFKAR